MQGDYYQLPTGKVAALYDDTPFPPLNQALIEPNGLLAIGGNLSAPRLLNAYQQGIFPWFNQGDPILWWSPDPRMVLFPSELKISHSLEKRLKKTDYEIRFNTAFNEVIRACAETVRRHDDDTYSNATWITDEIVHAYSELHQLGYAHSIETWINDKLVGGLYGVAIGKMFYGESMFHRVTDGSKLAFVHLVKQLQAQGVGMIDCQMKTSHLASLGAREISRADFSERLQRLTKVIS
jgi:leucyl/phenylalanyl-tRNA---protein transferase